MSIDRKQFLQLVVTGGLGAMFGGAAFVPKQWKEKGVSLTSVSRQSLVMGSIISFEVIAETESAGYEAIKKAEQVFRSLEKIFSMYDSESEMAMLAGQAGGRPVAISEEAADLLQVAKRVHYESDGRFDITIEPAMKRWGFRENPGKNIRRPTEHELRKLEQIIGSDKIVIENNKALLAEKGMALDTGGIAGGYALDKAIIEMKKCDITAAFINFSGDIHCFGQPMKGEKWPVYLLDPYTQQPKSEPVMLLNEALSTSGAYQNRRRANDEHSWGHLLLPDQAEPIEPIGSVTAIHPSAMVADAWSTASYIGAEPPSEVSILTM